MGYAAAWIEIQIHKADTDFFAEPLLKCSFDISRMSQRKYNSPSPAVYALVR
jgi:hypothetical protein